MREYISKMQSLVFHVDTPPEGAIVSTSEPQTRSIWARQRGGGRGERIEVPFPWLHIAESALMPKNAFAEQSMFEYSKHVLIMSAHPDSHYAPAYFPHITHGIFSMCSNNGKFKVVPEDPLVNITDYGATYMNPVNILYWRGLFSMCQVNSGSIDALEFSKQWATVSPEDMCNYIEHMHNIRSSFQPPKQEINWVGTGDDKFQKKLEEMKMARELARVQ